MHETQNCRRRRTCCYIKRFATQGEKNSVPTPQGIRENAKSNAAAYVLEERAGEMMLHSYKVNSRIVFNLQTERKEVIFRNKERHPKHTPQTLVLASFWSAAALSYCEEKTSSRFDNRDTSRSRRKKKLGRRGHHLKFNTKKQSTNNGSNLSFETVRKLQPNVPPPERNKLTNTHEYLVIETNTYRLPGNERAHRKQRSQY